MQDIALLESLLLKPFEEAFKQLVKGSDEYYYFMFLKLFHEKGVDLAKEEKELLSEFIARETSLSKKIMKRKMILQLDKYWKDERKRRILFLLLQKNVFNINEDYQGDDYNLGDVSREEEIIEDELEIEEVEKQEKQIDQQEEDNDEMEIQDKSHGSRVSGEMPNDECSEPEVELQQLQKSDDFDDEETTYYPSSLDPITIDMQAYLDKVEIYAIVGLSDIEPAYYHKLDFEKLLSQKHHDWITNYFNTAIDIETNSFAVRMICVLVRKNIFSNSYFAKLSLKQLQELENLMQGLMTDETYVLEIYQKEFGIKIRQSQDKSIIHEINQQAWKWSQTLHQKFWPLKFDILDHLINHSLENEFEIMLPQIIEYLKYASGTSHQFISEESDNNNQEWGSHNINISCDRVKKNFQEYCLPYLKDHSDLRIFIPYVEQTFLLQTEMTIKLNKGEQVGNLQEFFDEHTLQQMNNKKILKLISNKTQFKHGEEISIKCQMKNIQKLTVQIFQINNENYCFQKGKNADITITLEGQTSKEEIEFSYQYSPIEVFIKEFSFDSITKQSSGTFLIQFIGNGMKAKALITKGRLILQGKITSAGHALKILDENNQVCQGKRTGLWLEGQFYPTNQHCEIMIPFGKSQKNTQATLVNDDYAEMASIIIEAEEYKLSCPYVVDEEQFVSDSGTEILIFPKLSVAQQEIDIKLLQNATIKVQSINKSGAVTYSQIDKVVFSNDKPHTIKIRNVSNLQNTECIISGSVMSMSENKLISLTHTFTIDYQEASEITKQYVQYTKENGYIVTVLGRNGEVYPEIGLEFSFRTIFSTKPIIQKLKTNSQGQVYLGQLKYVDSFRSTSFTSQTETPNSLDYKIANNKTSQSNIQLTSELGTNSQQQEIINFTVQQPEEKYSVVVLVSQFLSSKKNENQYWGLLRKKQQYQMSEEDIKLFEIELQSNQSLNTEIQYVLNRKNYPAYIGNTLEKPGFLLCKQYIRDANNQDLESAAEDEEEHLEPQKKDKDKRRPCKKSESVYSYPNNLTVSTHQNFLKNSAQIIYLGQNQENKYQIILDNSYSQITVIVVNQNEVAKIPIGLKSQELYKKDTRHQSQLTLGKFYSTFRETILLKVNQEEWLNDFANKNFAIIDTFESAFTVLGKLQKLEYQELQQNLYFSWNSKELNEKIRLYNDQQSDELNLFLYFKDPTFCEVYIKPFIDNKIEKSFIDNFILQNADHLLKQTINGRFQQLNSLEKCLLFIYFNELHKDDTLSLRMKNYFDSECTNIQIDKKDQHSLFDQGIGCTSEQFENDGDSEIEGEGCGGGGGERPVGGYGGGGGQFYCCAAINQDGCAVRESYSYQNEECDEECEEERAPKPKCKKKRMTYCDDEEDYQKYNQLRQVSIQPFKNIKQTCEYCESHYTNQVMISEPFKFSYNNFYHDFVCHSQKYGVFKEPFISENFIYNDIASNTSSLSITMALLGFPFKQEAKVQQEYIGKDLKVTALTPALIMVKQLRELPKLINKKILVIQKFYDESNRYIKRDGEDIELELEEFEVKKVYFCEIVVTNCSSKKMNISLLYEIPNGSLPVDTTTYSKVTQVVLSRYSSRTFNFTFYFPSEGKFLVYPAVISNEKAVIAIADEYHFKVVTKSAIMNKDNLDDIIRKGSKEDILEYLKKNNYVNYSSISKLLKDKQFYLKCCSILREKMQLTSEILSHCLMHNDLEGFKEMIAHEDVETLLKTEFIFLKTSFVDVSIIRFFEYYPLQTRRVHNLAKAEQGILNEQFKEQYLSFLNYLIIKQQISDTEKIIFCYYLLLQSRINEAIQIYQGISNELKVGEPLLQYDYLTAYLDLYIGYPNFLNARKICEKYISYPIISWRNLFYEVMNLLAEFDGDEDKSIVEASNEQQKDNREAAKKEEFLEMSIENNQIKLSYANIKQVVIQHYLIDLEIVFSITPFLSDQSQKNFNYIQPFTSYVYELEQSEKQQTVNIPLPEQLKQKNQFIQVQGVTKTISSQYIETNLQVQISADSGQLRLSNQDGKYLEKVYIKTFVKKADGKVQFYKDGYTDLRGRFDYATLDPQSLEGLQKFAILIVSNDQGSIIKEVDPPSRVGSYEKEVRLQSKLWANRASKEQATQEQRYTQNVMKKCK